MQAGARTAAWDHTAALITHLRLVNGDKDANFEQFHPDTAREFQRAKLKSFSSQQLKKQGNGNE